MLVEASFTGLVKTLLMIIGAMVLLRFLGRVMIAKRNLEEERQLLKKQREFEKDRSYQTKNAGKVSILSKQKSKSTTNSVIDVDFEELT